MFDLQEETVCRRKAANQAWLFNTGLASPKLGAPCP
jgi:hypothetical protein